jgi:hypothetical protein
MIPKPCLTLLAAALSLPMGACATAGPAPPKACDGHHRRPANPNGSVLAAPDPSRAASPPPSDSGAAPPPADPTPGCGSPAPDAKAGPR